MLKIPSCSKENLEFAIDNYIIGRNAERNREIMKLHLIDGVCYEDLANLYQLTPRQFCNINKACMKIIIKHI